MGALLTVFGSPPFTPRDLFLASTIGAIYAYDDFAYLNQKADGSTPVTALEQPVGLVVDQRWGGAVGAERFVGTFDSTGAGWSYSGGVLTATAGSAGQSTYANIATNLTRYLVTFQVTATSGTLQFYQSGSLISNITASGTYTYRSMGSGGNSRLQFTSSSFVGSITNISVRELPGLHAYQATDAARPVLKGTPRYLNLDGTDDRLVTATGGGSTTGFLLVTGINVGGAGTARTIFSDRGTNTGYKVEVDAANNLVFTAGNGASFVSCTGPAITAGTSYVIACWHDGTNLNIKVGSGAVTSQAFATASAGTAAISIGRDNGAATGFYNGRLYPTVYIKDSTAGVGAINATMAWVAGKGGIAL